MGGFRYGERNEMERLKRRKWWREVNFFFFLAWKNRSAQRRSAIEAERKRQQRSPAVPVPPAAPAMAE